ncbi:ABC transporter ATP-binding protein [Bacillus australimaris]|uniref:ABC transporter ATP-binding protein n=1 Tax=Bacillus australimaris TaxID=1326968 RepID=A0ABD4QLY7_9BACI|nr:ABC transporter permease [Bacillus australimaris]KPN14156.1 ABC transporter ATP-binding protein [Bacillus australimaris]MBR8690357.1 ABC transporter permease [Bacillus australimaris]
MRCEFIKKDLTRHRLISIGLTICIMMTSFLAASAAQMTIQLNGSISNLLHSAKAPDFVQMHDGTLNEKDIDIFSSKQSMVKAHQIVPMIQIEHANIRFGHEPAKTGVMDHLFVKQNRDFDFLLNEQNEKLTVNKGEVAVPIYFQQKYHLNIGETLLIEKGTNQFSFRIKAFLRDAQMNPSLVSSKRFLLHNDDWNTLNQVFQKKEYLIEFLLHDAAQADAFQAIYQSTQLPQQGPSVTLPLLRMLNALTDGMVIAILLLVCILLISIALLSLRLAMTASIEEDEREIGILKVLGIPLTKIKQLYVGKYAVLACAGCIAGYVLTLIFGDMFTANIQQYMGNQHSFAHWLIPLLVSIVTAIIVISFSYAVLRKFGQISAAQAIQGGLTSSNHKKQIPMHLRKNRFLPVNIWLGLKDLLSRMKLYTTITCIIALCTFLMLIPIQLWHTLQSPDFITYLGSGKSDLRIDIRQGNHLKDNTNEIESMLREDQGIQTSAIYETTSLQAKSKENTLETLYLETGELSAFPLTYLQGRQPLKNEEIALSVLNADSLQKKVGEKMTLVTNGLEIQRTVTGIYQDVTNGGKTAKALSQPFPQSALWRTIQIQLKPGVNIAEKKAVFEKKATPAKVTDMKEYVHQTIGSTASIVKVVAFFSALAAFATASLMLFMFLHMLKAKDSSRNYMLRTIGFSIKDITSQYITSFIVVLSFGTFIGTIAVNTIGPALMSAGGASLGASSLQWLSPQWVSIVYPVTLLIVNLALTACLLKTFFSRQTTRHTLL